MSHWQLLIRHAHRDLHDRNLDNGLSPKGFEQCADLVEALQKGGFKPKRVLSSPKRRCLETAQSVASWAGVNVEVEENLDEQGSHERESVYRERVAKWWKEASQMHEVALVSHGDLIPLVTSLLGHPGLDIKKGDFHVVEDGHLKVAGGARSSR